MRADVVARRALLRPAAARHGGPPVAERAHARKRAREREFGDPVRPRRHPEMPLGADHPRQRRVQQVVDPPRVERPARAVDEGGDAVFLGFRDVLGETVQLLRPDRMLVRPVEVEQPGVEDLARIDFGEIGLEDARVGVERAGDLARGLGRDRTRRRDLVEHHDIGEFDLLGEQVHQRPRVLRAQRLAAIAQEVVARVIPEQVRRVHHRHHRVEAGDVGQAVARLVAELESGRDRQGFGDAGRFDQQVVEPPLPGEPPHLEQQIVAQRAADAAVRQFHQRLLDAAERGLGADEIGVDVHLGHVVDDDRDAPAVAVVEHAVEQRGLPRPEEAGEDGDGQAGIGGVFLVGHVFPSKGGNGVWYGRWAPAKARPRRAGRSAARGPHTVTL